MCIRDRDDVILFGNDLLRHLRCGDLRHPGSLRSSFGSGRSFTCHGARDDYIARLFLWRAMTTGLKGGFIGLAVSALALYSLSSFAGDLEGPLLDNLTLSPLDLLLLSSLPFLAALLTALTARHTVLRELSRIS